MMIDVCKRILEKNDNIMFALLFGSFATSKADKDSDIDIAIYLKDEEISLNNYLDLKVDLMDNLKREVDLVVLNSAGTLVKYRVCQEGKVIFEREEGIVTLFKVKTIFEYNDMKKYLDYSYNAMISSLKEEVTKSGKNRSN
jgi:predicted nucleotidyltransferase